jgi:sugar phosphate isomerase/epimerase
MIVGFASLGLADRLLQDVLDEAVNAGCEAIELNGRPTVHQGLWEEPVDYQAIRQAVEERGLAITSLGAYCDFAKTTNQALAGQVTQLIDYCRVAREMGIPVVRAFAGDVVEGYALDDLYPRLVDGFKAVTKEVADWGLQIGIENHGRLINNGDQLYRLIQDVDSPILGVTLDTGNFCWAGASVEEAHRFMKKLAPMTVNVHVKDGRYLDGQWPFVPAGRGEIDLPAVLSILHEAGYEGPVVSEYEGPSDFIPATIESVAYLRGLRDGLQVGEEHPAPPSDLDEVVG